MVFLSADAVRIYGFSKKKQMFGGICFFVGTNGENCCQYYPAQPQSLRGCVFQSNDCPGVFAVPGMRLCQCLELADGSVVFVWQIVLPGHLDFSVSGLSGFQACGIGVDPFQIVDLVKLVAAAGVVERIAILLDLWKGFDVVIKVAFHRFLDMDLVDGAVTPLAL